MKKILSLLILFFLLIPTKIYAFEYFLDEYDPIGDVYFKDSVLSRYKTNSFNLTLDYYLDGKSINDEIEEVPKYSDVIDLVYNVNKDMVVRDFKSETQGRDTKMTVHFESVPEDAKIHCYISNPDLDHSTIPGDYFDSKYCDDYIEKGNYYSSKDMLYKDVWASSPYFYYVDKQQYHVSDSLVKFFPEVDGKETYWVYTRDDNLGYQGYISPVFEAYVPPKFEFKCEPKTINQGEKATCTLYANTNFDLKNVHFNIDPKRYEIVDVTYPEGISNEEGDKDYNLTISPDLEQDRDGQVLAVFQITNTENKKFEENVEIVDLDFVDFKARAKYNNLEDPVEILALVEEKEEKNPETKSFSILIPVILFVSTFIVFILYEQTKKIKKIS